MNVIQIEATQGAVFSIVAHTDASLAGATATMTIVQGNCLDSSVSTMGSPGAVLAALTSTPAVGLVIDTGAGTVTATANATVTANWPAGWASFQMWAIPSAATRYLMAQGLIKVTDDISTAI